MTKTDEIMKAIEGTAHVARDDGGLARYHAAQRVKAALRRKVFSDQLAGVRFALSRYGVIAWANPENGRIVLSWEGRSVLTL